MQVTTGSATRTKLLFRIALAFGTALILASFALLWMHRDADMDDTLRLVEQAHERVAASVGTSVAGKSAAELRSILRQAAGGLSGGAIVLHDPQGAVVDASFDPDSPSARPEPLPVGSEGFRIPSSSDRNGRTFLRTVQPISAENLSGWLLVESDVSHEASGVDARAWKIGGFAFLIEGLLFVLLLWMARRGDESLMRSQREQIAMENELFFLSHYDTVTHLPNRTLFWERLDAAISRAGRLGKSVLLCVYDLDGFTSFNQEHGRSVGDRALQETSRRIQAAARSIDLVCRIGPDEFVVLVEDIESSDGKSLAEALDARIRTAFSVKWADESGERRLSLTGSAAMYPQVGSNSEDLLAKARQALSDARQRSRTFVFC